MKLQSLTAILLCTLQTFAGSLENGWTNFNNNNRKEAARQFALATQDPALKADAYLALSMVHRSCEEFDSAFVAFKAFFKSSPNPYPYTYALWTSGSLFSGYGIKKEAEVEFLKELTKDPKANGTLKSMAWYMLGKHYKSSNLLKESKAAFDKIGALENWQAVGTFENISASGFNKNWGALEHPEPAAKFRNRVNAEVSWFDVPYVRDDRWFDFTYNFPTGNTIVYGQTFVTSKEAKEAYLTAGNSGSLKIWVNDKLIISEEEERDCDMDIYTSSLSVTLLKSIPSSPLKIWLCLSS
jgi:tetratricopeptide (TPR) repeat protein